jgi:hypothetical protein
VTDGRTERASRVWEVDVNGPWWTEVDLVEGQGMSPITHALRPALEVMRIGVQLWPVANVDNVERLLRGQDGHSPYLLLAVHADGAGLHFLPGSVDRPEGTSYSVEVLRSVLRVTGRNVIALGCFAGSTAMTDAFLAAGATTYVAPRGAPFAHAAFTFVTLLFFHLTQCHSLEEAIENARAAHPEFEMWQMATGVPRHLSHH